MNKDRSPDSLLEIALTYCGLDALAAKDQKQSAGMH